LVLIGDHDLTKTIDFAANFGFAAKIVTSMSFWSTRTSGSTRIPHLRKRAAKRCSATRSLSVNKKPRAG
jgi:hypothetical protein